MAIIYPPYKFTDEMLFLVAAITKKTQRVVNTHWIEILPFPKLVLCVVHIARFRKIRIN